ncbi:uncharacterized protein [Macaca fascicularis]|uniref:uncharacterized protein n=1 Tax=Macaca fascicularis TaxID=9541 RepID=UPI003D15BC58
MTLCFLVTESSVVSAEVALALCEQTGVGPPRKGRFKFLAAELPSEKSTEEVVAVVNRDSALWASGPMEGPVEKFIYESDEEAPRQWQVRPPAVVTEKAGGLPEEKGCKEESLEDSNKGSAEDVPQHLKVTCADQENGSYKDSNFSETHHDKDSASGGDASASGADTEEPKCADGRQHANENRSLNSKFQPESNSSWISRGSHSSETTHKEPEEAALPYQWASLFVSLGLVQRKDLLTPVRKRTVAYVQRRQCRKSPIWEGGAQSRPRCHWESLQHGGVQLI